MAKTYHPKQLEKALRNLRAAFDGLTPLLSRVDAALAAGTTDSGAVESLVAEACAEARALAATVHDQKMYLEWRIAPPPEWFDHFLDLYLQWPRDGASLWLERGVFGALALRRGGRLLEMCCGDGFNSRHFYAPLVGSVLAVDFDGTALAHAGRYNTAANISFRELDVRTGLPDGPFDNVTWDAAIEHFTEDEIATLLGGIHGVLAPDGILSGYTVVERDDGGKHLEHHEREFRSMEDLVEILSPHFREVTVFETVHPARHNLYFYAGDGSVPFAADWPGLRVRRR